MVQISSTSLDVRAATAAKCQGDFEVQNMKGEEENKNI